MQLGCHVVELPSKEPVATELSTLLSKSGFAGVNRTRKGKSKST